MVRVWSHHMKSTRKLHLVRFITTEPILCECSDVSAVEGLGDMDTEIADSSSSEEILERVASNTIIESQLASE